MKKLFQQLKQLDNKGYKAYKSLQGQYHFNDFALFIDYVQGDPFATPSKIRVVILKTKRAIHSEWFETKQRKVAVEDTVARAVGKAIHNENTFIKGSGKSGQISFDTPGQEVLERSAVQLTPETITVCISVGLPANGRRINGREAEKLFSKAIPTIINQSVFSITDQELSEAMKLADQQEAIRKEMRKNNWITFIANGSILPRESGISNRPLKNAVPFQSPAEDEVSISIPHQSEATKRYGN